MLHYRVGMRVRLKMTGEEFEIRQVLDNGMLGISNDKMSLITGSESVEAVDGWRAELDEPIASP